MIWLKRKWLQYRIWRLEGEIAEASKAYFVGARYNYLVEGHDRLCRQLNAVDAK